MTEQKNGLIILPALRGNIGDWVYYSCLMSFGELARRVDYAKEVHSSKSLSDMIQRGMDERRTLEIASYLKEQPERFFNSLVVATYGGDPNWHPMTEVNHGDDSLKELTDEMIQSVGFLTLNGDENLFAVDGQHRLSGIKRVVEETRGKEVSDEISVIFVAHEQTPTGLQRTRRLFTTLNKTARLVSKGDIIALDEDDAMAICVRRLIEETRFFKGRRIAFVANNNMPVSNTESLTTIGNLYDTLGILFCVARTDIKKRPSDLKRARPGDEALEKYFDLSNRFFSEMEANIEEWSEFFNAEDTRSIVAKYRGSHGGSALFRPVGIDAFTRVVAVLTNKMPLSESIDLASRLPRTLTAPPWLGLMWNADRGTITNAHKATLRDTMLYMVGAFTKSKAELLDRYRRDTGDDKAELPDPVWR